MQPTDAEYAAALQQAIWAAQGAELSQGYLTIPGSSFTQGPAYINAAPINAAALSGGTGQLCALYGVC